MTLGELVTDQHLHRAVVRELMRDPLVAHAEIGVQVCKGAVALTGGVSSFARKIAAEGAVRRVEGVVHVSNDLVVGLPGTLRRSDMEIANAVRRALQWDDVAEISDMRAFVDNGWVTLEGDVNYWAERNFAERAVRVLAGVRGVTNNLTVGVPRLTRETLLNTVERAMQAYSIPDSQQECIDSMHLRRPSQGYE